MKTSNKLLIALAALLIIIPIIVVAVNVKMNYRIRKGDNFVENQEPFESTSKDRVSIPIKTTFSTVNIPDAKRIYLELNFIKSTQSGVKIPDEVKNDIVFNVNNAGILQINFSDRLNRPGNHYDGIVILVYSPNIDKLNVGNASSIVLTAKTDSLGINVKNSGQLMFGSPVTFSTDGKITRVINQTEIKNLTINLDSTAFSSGNNNYKNLNITCKNSSASIEAEEEEENKNIENLSVKAFGKSEIKINKFNINKISGNLSDETKVQMPVKYLKQLLKD
ncbi:GIN domain-containing protein [Pedobacter sp. KLB.chiD]|uniref:GIN domain-containing protein n=1 Tax=Pedobacter sp. KLB.chiD TaxID=3387402 RepID=UPI00399B790B